MKLEVGKSYKDRVGNVVTVNGCFEFSQPSKYTFIGCNGQKYTKRGVWDIHAKTDKDLIEELNMLHLEVGKKYKERDGNVIEIEIIEKDPFYGDFCCVGKRSDGVYRRYRPDGKYIFDDCESDLIEELEEVNIKLEVGKKYRNRNGDIVIIQPQPECFVDIGRPFVGLVLHTNTKLWYTEKGHHIADYTKSMNDLVEEMNEGIKDKSFKTSQDAHIYLANGGIIKNIFGNSIFYFENGDITYECLVSGEKNDWKFKGVTLTFNLEPLFNLEKYERPVIKNWYDDIPKQGILCVVTTIDGGKEFKSLAIIIVFEGNYYRCDSGFLWDDARPATIEDLKQYLYETK